MTFPNRISLSVCFLALLPQAVLGTGCATIFKGTTTEVRVASNPEGAKIYRNGEYLGNAPVTLVAKGNESYYIEAKKEGYQDNTKSLPKDIGAGWVVLDLLSGLIGILVDATTGAWYYFPEATTVTLEKK